MALFIFLVIFIGGMYGINRLTRNFLEGDAPPDFPRGVPFPGWLYFIFIIAAFFLAYGVARLF
jgi:hypothetical protein